MSTALNYFPTKLKALSCQYISGFSLNATEICILKSWSFLFFFFFLALRFIWKVISVVSVNIKNIQQIILTSRFKNSLVRIELSFFPSFLFMSLLIFCNCTGHLSMRFAILLPTQLFTRYMNLLTVSTVCQHTYTQKYKYCTSIL